MSSNRGSWLRYFNLSNPVFANPSELPPHRSQDHKIPLFLNAMPVSVKPFRYSYSKKNEMERLVGEMLVACIIQPSNNPFSSLALLVRKKYGGWRFCVDYRQLNKVTIPDKYPIHVIQEMLDELGGAQYFSKLDLRSGYHQIRVVAENVQKTAFRTHSRH